MSITNKLNQIKNAIYGKEVRGAIHDAIKECYDDASVNHDNANMEVKMARGTHNTLNDRLDNVDEIQAQTNAQLSHIETQMQDVVLVGCEENVDIKNEVLEAFKKTNHVKIRKGNFKFSQITLPRSDLTLSCEDGCNLLMLSSTGIFASGKENINIKDLKIDGGNILVGEENGSSAIYMENVKNLNVENVKTDNTGAWGIVVTNGSKNITLNNNKCNGSKRQSGIALSGECSNFTIDGNYCCENYYSGIIVEPNCVNGDIINNKCINNFENGIIIVDCGNSLINIDNNTVLNSKSNITSIRNQKVNITNNKINGGTLGIQVEKNNLIDIKHNNISDCDSMGVSILSGDGQPKMVDVVVKDNSVVNCTLTDTRENAASYFIRDCVDLIFAKNISNNNKQRDYTINSNTFLELDLVTPSLKSPKLSYLTTIKKPYKFEVVLNSNKNSETLKLPYDLDLYSIKISKMVASNNNGFTQLKFNDEAIVGWGEENGNLNKTMFKIFNITRRFSDGDELKISYAHSINMDYVKDVKVELIYF